MSPADFDAFLGEFRRLSGALERRPQSVEQLRTRADAYFHVLKDLPLPTVIAKADAWLAHGQKFPLPVEWARQRLRAREAVTLSDAQIAAYGEAKTVAFQGEPCTCDACQRAGVTHRFTRFVPVEDADGMVPMMHASGPDGPPVYAGRWIHGEDLRRWYAAQDRFYALKGTLKGPLAAIFQTLEMAAGGRDARHHGATA